jgi:probable phosphoglycerate mutase
MGRMTAGSGQRDEPTELIVVRHGQSRGNVEGRFGGHGPTPLTDLGRRQAAAAGRHLAAAHAPSVLVSSDLIRARQTAEAIAEATGLDPVHEPGFRERSVGDWDDLLFTEVAERFPDDWERMTRRDFTFCPPGAETIDAVYQRVGRALDQLLAAHPGERVVLVSHGIAIFHLFSTICGLGSPSGKLGVFTLVDNASISRFRWQSETWRILSLNETHHLAGVATE